MNRVADFLIVLVLIAVMTYGAWEVVAQINEMLR